MNIQFLRINTKTAFENLPNKDTTYKNAVVFIKDTKEIWNDGIYYGAGSKGLIPITHAELVNLRDNAELIPGMYYRITDYECTTTLDETRSAGHAFDIIVMALSEDTVSEMCSAILHDGDEYFANSKLNAWQIWYDLNNDVTKYLWADPDGKGVIYRMIDEFNNDCPYDFKNILFKRYWSDGITVKNEIICEGYYNTTDSGSTGDFIWVYTFHLTMYNNIECDGSLNKDLYRQIDDNDYHPSELCAYNIIHTFAVSQILDDSKSGSVISLNNIIFMNLYDENRGNNVNDLEGYKYELNHNCEFYADCYNMTFGNNCFAISMGYNCSDNQFGNNCDNNQFGNSCGGNQFGNNGYIYKLCA